jgi:hypothetical protein
MRFLCHFVHCSSEDTNIWNCVGWLCETQLTLITTTDGMTSLNASQEYSVRKQNKANLTSSWCEKSPMSSLSTSRPREGCSPS